MRLDQVVVVLECGGTAVVRIEVDPAGCRDVGHSCPTPEQIAAMIWASIQLAELESPSQHHTNREGGDDA